VWITGDWLLVVCLLVVGDSISSLIYLFNFFWTFLGVLCALSEASSNRNAGTAPTVAKPKTGGKGVGVDYFLGDVPPSSAFHT
jgi:hypothetical protein